MSQPGGDRAQRPQRSSLGKIAVAITIAILPVLALTVGLARARADELSDLRAKQEALQRRLDDLAQTPSGGEVVPGVGPPVGGAPAAGSFPRSFLIPGTDTSMRIGGEGVLIGRYGTR